MRDRWRWRRRGPVRALVRTDLLAALEDLELWRAPSLPPARLAADTGGRTEGGGRGIVAILPAGSLGEAVLRPYRRGGLPGRLVRSRYLFGDRAFRELILTERLHRAALPVPEPLAALQERRLPGYRAALLTRRVPGVSSLADLLRGSGGETDGGDAEAAGRDRPGPEPVGRDRPHRSRVKSWLRRTGSSLGRLHAAGAWHADPSAGNFLLDGADEAEAVVLDWDRGRLLPPPLPRPLTRLNLRRLRRSLRKLGARGALEAWPALEEAHARSMDPP